MEMTPTEHIMMPFLPDDFDGLGPPPPLRGRSQSFGDEQPDMEMHDMLSHMHGMQLEETKESEGRPQPFQTPDRGHIALSYHVPMRQPFQAMAVNRRTTRRDYTALSSPSDHLYVGSNMSCSSSSEQRDRSNSFLVHNAPRLPASPELDYTASNQSSSRAELFPPPIFSPLHKYTFVNNHVANNSNNALLRDNVSTNDITISAYYNVCHTSSSSNNSNMAQSPAATALPPSMPMIGSPSPPVDGRKLPLKMRKGYVELNSPNILAPQFTMYGC
jgi:hypothetical protein